MHGRRFRHILGIKRSNTLLLTNIRRRSYLGKACTTNRHESFVYNCIPKHKKEESLRKQGHSDYIFGVVVLIRKLESLWKLFHYINIVTVFWLIVTKKRSFFSFSLRRRGWPDIVDEDVFVVSVDLLRHNFKKHATTALSLSILHAHTIRECDVWPILLSRSSTLTIWLIAGELHLCIEKLHRQTPRFSRCK